MVLVNFIIVMVVVMVNRFAFLLHYVVPKCTQYGYCLR